MINTASKELKLRFKKNAKQNEIWIDPCYYNNLFYQELLNLFGEAELYTYEHQFDQALGEKILYKNPSKGFLIYRVFYLLDKNNECWIIVNDKKIRFNWNMIKNGKGVILNYLVYDKDNNGRSLSVSVNSYYSTNMIVKELLQTLVKQKEFVGNE